MATVNGTAESLTTIPPTGTLNAVSPLRYWPGPSLLTRKLSMISSMPSWRQRAALRRMITASDRPSRTSPAMPRKPRTCAENATRLPVRRKVRLGSVQRHVAPECAAVPGRDKTGG